MLGRMRHKDSKVWNPDERAQNILHSREREKPQRVAAAFSSAVNVLRRYVYGKVASGFRPWLMDDRVRFMSGLGFGDG